MEITERQQEIVNAAIKIIARKGYRELTTKHLSEDVGVSEAALYRHFDSKNGLIHTILQYFQEVSHQVLINIIKEIKDPMEQVKAFVMSRYTMFRDNPDLAGVMFSEEIFKNDRSLAEHNLKIMHSHRDVVLKSIRVAQQKNEIRDDLEAIQLFRIIIGSMRLLVTQWQLCGYEFELVTEGEKLWQTINKSIIKESK